MIPFAAAPVEWLLFGVVILCAVISLILAIVYDRTFAVIPVIIFVLSIMFGAFLVAGYIQQEQISICKHIDKGQDGLLVLNDEGTIYSVYDPIAEMLVVDDSVVTADVKYYPFTKPIITRIYGNVTCGVARCA